MHFLTVAENVAATVITVARRGNRGGWKALGCGRLLHQEHLAGAFDGAAEAALVVGREAGVFAREDATLVGNKLAEQIDVFEIEGIDGEVHFGLGARGALFHHRTAAAVFAAVAFLFMSFAWHNRLLD